MKVGGEVWRADGVSFRSKYHRRDEHRANMEWLRMFPLIADESNHDPGDEDRSER